MKVAAAESAVLDSAATKEKERRISDSKPCRSMRNC